VRSGFEGTARVVSGTTPSRVSVQPYRVSVSDGRLLLRPLDRAGTVLDVALDRVSARPVGRAGATRVEVDGSPILVDLTNRDHGDGAWGILRRAGYGVSGRLARRTLLGALRGAGR
jgi:hypothetical protein